MSILGRLFGFQKKSALDLLGDLENQRRLCPDRVVAAMCERYTFNPEWPEDPDKVPDWRLRDEQWATKMGVPLSYESRTLRQFLLITKSEEVEELRQKVTVLEKILPEPEVTPQGTGVVYFIESDGKVKIGFTGDLKSRMGAIATTSPSPITLLGSIPGTMKDEKELHKRLEHYRCHGEWFKLTFELREHIVCLIERHRNGFPSVSGIPSIPDPPVPPVSPGTDETKSVQMAYSYPLQQASKRVKCISWINEFHQVEGGFPTWTEVRKKFNLSAASASRYLNQAKMAQGQKYLM